MIENGEEIVLDSTNNVFVGPDKYFKIVIDEFDGKVIKAWHIEDSKGNKTENLADRAQGKHIDVMVNQACRTVAHFTDRYQSDIFKYQQDQITKLATTSKKAPEPAPAPKTTAPQSSNGVPIAVPVVIAVITIAVIAIQANRNKNNNKSA